MQAAISGVTTCSFQCIDLASVGSDRHAAAYRCLYNTPLLGLTWGWWQVPPAPACCHLLLARHDPVRIALC